VSAQTLPVRLLETTGRFREPCRHRQSCPRTVCRRLDEAPSPQPSRSPSLAPVPSRPPPLLRHLHPHNDDLSATRSQSRSTPPSRARRTPHRREILRETVGHQQRFCAPIGVPCEDAQQSPALCAKVTAAPLRLLRRLHQRAIGNPVAFAALARSRSGSRSLTQACPCLWRHRRTIPGRTPSLASTTDWFGRGCRCRTAMAGWDSLCASRTDVVPTQRRYISRRGTACRNS
jgi:hypothetical protein